jgi:hypothetical protein
LPTISRFFGILVRMYHDKHNPPDFHVIYGEHHAVVGIQDFAILEGIFLHEPFVWSASGPGSIRPICWRSGFGHGKGRSFSR